MAVGVGWQSKPRSGATAADAAVATFPAVAVAALALVAGVALAGWLPSIPLAGIAAALGLTALVARRWPLALAALALVCLAAGAWRAQTVRAVGSDDISRLNGQRTVVWGIVADRADQRERFHRFVVEVTAAGDPPSPASGRVQVDATPEVALLPGDIVVLRGRLDAPPSFPGFDYRAVLERQGIRSTMRFPEVVRSGERAGLAPLAALAAARDGFRDSLRRALPQPQAALAAGLVIGGREDLPLALREAFARTGTSHLLAVSGYNMMVVAAGTLGLLVPLLGVRYAAVGALVAIWLFAGVTTGTPAVLRAAVMASLGLVGLLAGRQRSGLLLLGIAAAALVLISPSHLDDVGFQLSVAATAGLLTVGSPLAAWLRRLPLLGAVWLAPLREAAASTIAAVLATLPIVVLTFGSISLVAVPVNMFAAPLIAPAMAAGALCGVAGMLSPPLGQFLAAPAWLFTSALATLVELAAALPGAAVSVATPPAEVVILASLTVGLALLGPVRGALLGAVAAGAGRWRALFGLAALGALASWAAVGATSARHAAVSFVEGGAVARTPGGRTVVVDGGGSAGLLLAELDRLLPVWDRRVDLYVATSWRPENVGALNDVVRRLPIDRVAGPPFDEGDQRWVGLIGDRRLPFTAIDRPTDVALGDGSRLWLEPAGRLAVRLALPEATIALNEAGRRRGAPLGPTTDPAGRAEVAVASARYPLGRHGAVRLTLGTEVRVFVERP
jgi:competence protein ComEC